MRTIRLILIVLLLTEISPKLTSKDIYPTRQSIKGIQPDFQDPNQIIGNAIHGVAFNFVWEVWQPSPTSSCSSGQYLYDGYCFNIDQHTVDHVKTYSDNGVVVTGVFYGVPGWARRDCPSSAVTAPMFCAPKNENARDYGRFVGFIAQYFNGENGHGRVADFVIHNEVNSPSWFNIGCSGTNCKNRIDEWVSVYAQSYNNAYDYAVREQNQAKVLISFEHHFFSYWDGTSLPEVSVETFLTRLVPYLGSRQWKLAYHSYPPDLTIPHFGANDYPRITFGNIGVLAGWLRKNYPNDPHAWEIELTENGVNGPNGQEGQQNTMICELLRNILGTPGITSLIYHRLVDIKEEGLNLGLWRSDASQKASWTTYACANRQGSCAGVERWPACGFEYGEYTLLKRAYDGTFHWVSSRMFPDGVYAEQQWKLFREPREDTTMVYECKVGGANGSHTMISKDANCEGQFSMGPMGYIFNDYVEGTEPIYRCYNPNNGDHLITTSSSCEGFTYESLVGYAYRG